MSDPGARATVWWSGWRGELVMVALASSLVLVAFPTIAFGGRMFGTGWTVPGVDGTSPPPAHVDVPADELRSDRGASAWQFDPWAEVTSAAWHAGDVPLWNPYQGMGTPHAAAFQAAVFDPLLAAVNLHPTPLTWDVSFLLAFLLGAAAMFLFLRDCGLDRLPAFVGTMPFILSGFFFLYSNNQFFRSYLYLPVLLLLARWTLRSHALFAPVALGAALAGHLFVGMPESSVLVLGTCALYCAYLVAIPPSPIRRRVVLVRFATAALLGVALAAPLLIPGLELINRSVSTHQADGGAGLVAFPARDLLRWLTPYALGKGGAAFSLTRNWVGGAGFIAVIGALASPRTILRHGGWFFVVLAAAVLAKAYDVPAVRWVGELPILERVTFPAYASPIVSFALAVLAGIGCQGAVDGDLRRRRFLLLVAFGLLGVWALVQVNRSTLAGLTGNFLVRQFGLAVVAGACVTGALLVRRPMSIGVVAVAVLAELLLLAPRGIYTERADTFVRPPWLRYLLDQLGTSQERVFARDLKLFPNTGGAYGLQDIRSLNALHLDRYATYIGRFIQPGFADRFLGSESDPGEIVDNPMFDLTGVRYVVTGEDAGGDVVRASQYRKVASWDGVDVYENSRRMPRALVLHDVTPVPDQAEALRFFESVSRRLPNGFLRLEQFDPSRSAVVENLSPSVARHIRGCEAPGRATIRAYDTDAIVLDVDTECPGIVVLTDMYYPGWDALVNGRAALVHPADIAFRGVPVEAGHSTVTFRYRPASFRLGVAIATLASIAAVGGVVFSLAERRKRGSLAPPSDGPPSPTGRVAGFLQSPSTS